MKRIYPSSISAACALSDLERTSVAATASGVSKYCWVLASHRGRSTAVLKRDTRGVDRATPTKIKQNTEASLNDAPRGSNPTISNSGPTISPMSWPSKMIISTPLPPGPPGLIKIGPRYFEDLGSTSAGFRMSAMDALRPDGSAWFSGT